MDYKPFSEREYRKNDERAKHAGTKFLVQKGCILRFFDIEFYKDKDFSVSYGGQSFDVEVEVKNIWKVSGVWLGYRTVSVPARKRDSISDIYILFNNSLNTLLYCPMKDVLESKVIRKDTNKGTEDEPFFDVHITKFRMEALNSKGIWEEKVSFGGKSIKEILEEREEND